MKFLAVVLLVAAVHAKHEMYIGWKTYFVKPASQDQLQKLGSKIPEFDLDFLNHATLDREGVVLVKPQYQAGFLKFLSEENILHWLHSDDLKTQFDIEDQMIEERNQQTRSLNGARLPYDNYQTLDVIYEYIDRIADQYPETVTLVQNSKSFEGRPLKYLKVSKDNFSSNKPVIYIDGGIHAREWISPPTVTYAIHKLVENVTEPDLLERFDWILFPVVNPDGYEFSHKSDRMWRKTRSTGEHWLTHLCPGVDGNRNFDVEWNTVGSSFNPCTEIYAGSEAFSESETRTVHEIINAHVDRMVLFLTMHSYGSMILYPWGHTDTLSQHAFALQSVGNSMAETIDRLSLPHFPSYNVGNSMIVIQYATSGAAEDYAHHRGVPLAYTYELPGLDQGSHLDPKYIHQVCVETWAGIAVGARRAGDMFGNK